MMPSSPRNALPPRRPRDLSTETRRNIGTCWAQGQSRKSVSFDVEPKRATVMVTSGIPHCFGFRSKSQQRLLTWCRLSRPRRQYIVDFCLLPRRGACSKQQLPEALFALISRTSTSRGARIIRSQIIFDAQDEAERGRFQLFAAAHSLLGHGTKQAECRSATICS